MGALEIDARYKPTVFYYIRKIEAGKCFLDCFWFALYFHQGPRVLGQIKVCDKDEIPENWAESDVAHKLVTEEEGAWEKKVKYNK